MPTTEGRQLRLGELPDAPSDAGAAASAVGLSTCHISPQVHLREARVTVAVGGNFIKLRGPELSGDTLRAKANRHRITPRGTIKSFSPRSRHRLLEKLACIDQRQVPYSSIMATLTYPENWSGSPAQWKRDLQNFIKRLIRRYPRAAIIWRLEPQKRGAPHFHLLIFNIRYLPFDRVAQDWASITNGNPESCSRVERVRSWRGVMSYASKYLAKLGDQRQFLAGPGGQALDEVGRLWGIVNGDQLPADVRHYALELAQFHKLRRTLNRHKSAILRRSGIRHIRNPRDATIGASAFLDWPTAIRLVDSQLGNVPLYPLLRESMKLEERVRWEREAESTGPIG